jgi:hypothetical protein
VRPEQAVPTIQGPLPPVPPEALRPDADGKALITLLLFYQYVEPMWTEKEVRGLPRHAQAALPRAHTADCRLPRSARSPAGKSAPADSRRPSLVLHRRLQR